MLSDLGALMAGRVFEALKIHFKGSKTTINQVEGAQAGACVCCEWSCCTNGSSERVVGELGRWS